MLRPLMSSSLGNWAHQWLQRMAVVALLSLMLCLGGYAQKRVLARVDSMVEHRLEPADSMLDKRLGKADSLLGGRLARMDRVLAERYYRQKFDTAFILRPAQRWNVALTTRLTTNSIDATTRMGGISSHLQMRADWKYSLGVKVGYSGLALTLSFNPAKLVGRETDWGLNLSGYGNRLGGEARAVISSTMRGKMTLDDTVTEIGTGYLKQYALYANGYYAFNFRKFSYPAALTQSYVQRRSAGSWLLGASLYASRIDVEDIIVQRGRFDSVTLGLGGGYGFNWVPNPHWLLHISCTPSLCVFTYSMLHYEAQKMRMRMQFPEFIIAGRGAINYNYRNLFVGASLVFNYSANGRADNLKVATTNWNGRAYLGLRF